MSNAGRYLIAIGVPECPHIEEMPILDQVAGDVERVTALLTSASQGYERVLADRIPLGTDSRQMETALYGWFNDPARRDDDLVIVYFAGHGDAGSNRFDEHCLLTSDAMINRPDTVFATAKFAPIFFGGSRQQKNVLLILDVCQAGYGGSDVLQRALGKSKVEDSGAGFWVLSSTGSYNIAHDGPFVTALSAVLGDPRHASISSDAYLSPNDIVVAINRWFCEHRVQQRAECSMIRSRAQTLFFRNPTHVPVRHDADAVNQAILLHAASGADVPGTEEWYFSGRETALDAINAWLSTAAPVRNVMVITGLPGSGKSALLGKLVQDDRRRERRNFQAYLYAKDETLLTFTQKLAIALGCAAREPLQLLAELNVSERRAVVMIDGLDEAREALAVEIHLLQGLSRCRGIKLLVATRSQGKRLPLADDATCLDLDTPPYFARSDMEHYILTRLRGQSKRSPHACLSFAATAALTQHIAGTAGTSFLYARLACQAVLRIDEGFDTSTPGWQTHIAMPKGIDEAYRLDFQRFDDIKRRRFYALLTALAYAKGQGLPDGALWCAVANRLGGGDCTVDDVIQLIEEAGFYLLRSGEPGKELYRLFHQTLVDFLKARGVGAEREAAFFAALLEHVPTTQASMRFSQVTIPYVRHQFAAHAAASGKLDRYLDDPDLLTSIAPADLLPYLPLATSPRGQQLASAYKRCWYLLRTGQPIAFLSQFALACVEHGLTDVQQRINAFNRDAAWRPLGVLGMPGRRSEVYARGRDTITSLALSSDDHGQPVAVCGYDSGRLALIGLQRDDALLDLPFPTPQPRGRVVSEKITSLVTLRRDDDILIATAYGKTLLALYVLSPNDWTCRQRTVVGVDQLQALCFSERDGQPVLVSCTEHALAIWRIPDLACLQSSAQASKGKMYGLTAFRQSGRQLIAVINDTVVAGKPSDTEVVRIWDAADLTLRRSIGKDVAGLVFSVHPCHIGQRLWLLIGDHVGNGLLVDPLSSAALRCHNVQFTRSYENKLGKVRHVHIVGEKTVVTSQQGKLLYQSVLSHSGGESDKVLIEHDSPPMTLESELSSVTEDGAWLIAAAPRQLHAYRMDEVFAADMFISGEFQRFFSKREILGSVRENTLTYIGDHLGSVSCWSDTGCCLWHQPNSSSYLRGVALSSIPAGPCVVIIMANGMVELRNPADGELWSTFNLPGEVISMKMAPHKTVELCFVCLRSNHFYAVRAWDLATATEIDTEIGVRLDRGAPGFERQFEFHSDEARHAFCMKDYLKTKPTAGPAHVHDGERLLVLCGGAYGEIRAFDFDTFDEVDFWISNVDAQDNAYVNVLAVTKKDSDIVVITGNDTGGMCRHTLGDRDSTLVHEKAHIGMVSALVALGGPQAVFVSGGVDGTLKFWNGDLNLLDNIELGVPVNALQAIGSQELVVTTGAGIIRLQIDPPRLAQR